MLTEKASEMTLKQLSKALNIPIGTVNNYCEKNGLLTKNAHSKKRNKVKEIVVNTDRPPTVYSQIPSPYGIATELRS